MALSEEELLQQVNVLTTKTSDNPNMIFKSNGAMNKALNPTYFTTNNTKIVNAINLLAKQSAEAIEQSNKVSENVGMMLGSLDSSSGLEAWNNLADIIQNINPLYNTAIDAMVGMLQGKAIGEILQINGEDKGKVLAIDVDDEGDIILKAIESIGGGGTPPTATDVKYENENKPGLTNVSSAIDYILKNFKEGPIAWDDVFDKPEIVDGLEITDDELVLLAGEERVSAVQLLDDEDLENIVFDLEYSAM